MRAGGWLGRSLGSMHGRWGRSGRGWWCGLRRRLGLVSRVEVMEEMGGCVLLESTAFSFVSVLDGVLGR